MMGALSRFKPAVYVVGIALLCVAVCAAGWWVLDRASTPTPADTTPAVSSDPHGSVVTYEVNGRTVACAVIDPPGEAVAMSCDWTGEATK